MSSRLWIILTLLLASGCTDYNNRSYLIRDLIPLKSLSIKVEKASYRKLEAKTLLEVDVEITNRAPDRKDFALNEIVLRVGMTREVAQHSVAEPPSPEHLSLDASKLAKIHLAFLINDDELKAPLALIVDRQPSKKGEKLTLIRLKGSGLPREPVSSTATSFE